jgi:hypothetical protein
MKNLYRAIAIAFCLVLAVFLVSRREDSRVRANSQAKAAAASPFTDFHGEQPGRIHHITVADLPQPYATKSSAVFSRPVPRPPDAWPQAPAGFWYFAV